MLKIKFWRIENVILMKILEQGDEIERGNFGFEASNGVNFLSAMNPALSHDMIYLRGGSIELDETISTYDCITNEGAKARLKAYVEAVKECNNSLQHTAVEDVEDIETVIAE